MVVKVLFMLRLMPLSMPFIIPLLPIHILSLFISLMNAKKSIRT